MRKNIKLLDHVERPDVLAVGRGAHQLAAIADVIDFFAVDGGGGANSLDGPILDNAGGQLFVDALPKKLAGRLLEAHDDAAVALDLGIAWLFVVGTDQDFAVANGWAAIGLGTEILHPEYVG